MRGVKTFPLRMERQCANAVKVAGWLGGHAKVERVHFPSGEVVRRLLPAGQFGAMVSFEIREASRAEIFGFMDRLKMIVRATSLGDVHSMLLYPWMSSHRDVSPEQRRAWASARTWCACRWASKRSRTSSPTSPKRSETGNVPSVPTFPSTVRGRSGRS